MKRAVVVLGVFGVLLGGCATETRVNRVAAHTFAICDQESGGACIGANAEHGITRVCLPWGQSIARVHKVRKTIYVTCGGPIK